MAVRTEPSGQRWTTSPFIFAGIRGAIGRAVTRTVHPSPDANRPQSTPGSPVKDASTFGNDQFCRPPTTESGESTAMNGIDTSTPRPLRVPTPPNTSWYGPTGVAAYEISPPIATTGLPRPAPIEAADEPRTPRARDHHTTPALLHVHGASGAEAG